MTGYTLEEVAKIPLLPADELLRYLDASASALAQSIREMGSSP